MGSYLSKGTEAGVEPPPKYNPPVYGVADVQKVTFADPPASEGKPSPASAAAGPPESVLKREGAPRRRGRPSAKAAEAAAAAATPASAQRPRRAARSPRAAKSPAVAAAAPTPEPAAPTPRGRGRPPSAKKAAKAAAAVAAPAPELVVVGRAAQITSKRQKGAVPARKVGMKRVAQRALKPVGGGKPARSKKL